MRIPFFGPPEQLTKEEGQVLVLIGLAFMLIAYDHGLYSLALKQIQADLVWADGDVGKALGIIRLGALPGILLAAMADKVGRRKLLMATLVCTGIFTGLTAFAQTPAQYVALQTAAKTFAFTEEALSIVVVAETMRASMRGWALAILGVFNGLGNGLASILFGFIDHIGITPDFGGWRTMYLAGTAPLFILAWLRRVLPETDRFKEHQKSRNADEARGLLGGFTPVKRLISDYPGRTAALFVAITPFGFCIVPATLLMSKHMQEGHGFDPGLVSVIYIAGGAVAMIGNLLVGRISDRVGRKRAIATTLMICAGGFALLYGTTPGPIIAVAWMFAIFGYFATEVMFNSLGSELFPTSYRSTASSFRVITYAVTGTAGLIMQDVLYDMFGGDYAMAIVALMAVVPIGAIVVMVFLPEPASKELEEVSPEVSAKAIIEEKGLT